MNVEKKILQLTPIVGNGFYQLIPSLVNLFMSFWVVSSLGSNAWGIVVGYQLFYYIMGAFVAWGNKDQLLLLFSKEPAKWQQLWQTSFATRLVLLGLPVLGVCFVFYPSYVAWHLLCWIICRFVTQSAEVLVVYRKNYKVGILSEALPLVLLLVIALWSKSLTEEKVLGLLTFTQIIRLLIWLVAERNLFFTNGKWRINPALLRDSLPFMLLGMSGFLQTKIDLYGMSFFADSNTVGVYQVFTSYVNLFLLVPGFLIVPYLKNIYRLQEKTLKLLMLKLMLTGLVGGGIFLVACYIGIKSVYGLNISWGIYGLAYFYIVSPLFFSMHIYQLFKKGHQRFVVTASFTGIGLNLMACYLLIPSFGITGAMVANVVSGTYLWVMYWWGNKRKYA